MIAFADIKSIKRTNKKLFMRRFFFHSYILNIYHTVHTYLANISVSGAERLNSFFFGDQKIYGYRFRFGFFFSLACSFSLFIFFLPFFLGGFLFVRFIGLDYVRACGLYMPFFSLSLSRITHDNFDNLYIFICSS